MDKKEVIAIIRSLLTANNSSYGMCTLNRDFKEMTGVDVPLFGYGSLSSFLESIPDTVKLTGSYPRQKVSLVVNNTSGHIVSLIKRERRDKKFKKGINITSGGCNMTSNRWNNKYNAAISSKISDFEQSSLPRLIQTIQLKQDDIQSYNTKCHSVTIKSNSLQEMKKKVSMQKDQFKKEMILDRVKTTKSSLGKKSQDYVYCNGIKEINLELYAAVGDYVEVYPCEISNPGHFYFHFRQFKRKLSTFMDNLQKFYAHNIVPKLCKEPELKEICAVLYSRHGDVPQWYRVEVEEILSDCLVVVRLVDYGTTAKVLTKNLTLLHSDFVDFPRQAVKGSLANIKPFGQDPRWSKSSTRRFHELAFCEDLVGGVVSVDCDGYSISLALSSTKGKEVHINDKLVEENFAAFDFGVEEAETGKSNLSQCQVDPPTPVFFKEGKFVNHRLQKLFTA